MQALIYHPTSYEGQVRAVGSDLDESKLATWSGGFKFNWNSEDGFFETPILSASDADRCLTNLENSE